MHGGIRMVLQHNMASMMTNRQLGITSDKLNKSTMKLSTGYKINSAADNPSGLSMSEKMRSQIRGLEQAGTNMQDAVSLIQIADGAMSEISDILQRINVLCVKAATDTNEDVDRAAVQSEINELTKQIQQITDDTEFNDIKVLKGHSSSSPVYGIKGALPAFMKSPQANSTPLGTLSDKYQMYDPAYTSMITNITDSQGNPVSTITDSSGNTYTVGQPYATNASKPALNSTNSQMTVANPNTGTLRKTIAGQSYSIELTEYHDADLIMDHSAAYLDFSNVNASNMNQLIGNGFNTTCCTCNSRYSINFVAPGQSSGMTTQGNHYVYDVELDASNIAPNQTVADYILGQIMNGLGSGIYSQNVTDSYNNSFVASRPNIHYTLITPELDANGNKTGRLAIFDRRTNIKPNPAYGEGLFDEGIYTIISNGQGGSEFLNIQTGPNPNDSVKLYLPNTETTYLGLNNTINVSSFQNATDSISTVQNALGMVSSMRGDIGAMQNRFEHGIMNADNARENTVAAESRIRDTDIAAEMVNFAKHNIFLQANQSLLAQANSQPYKILELFK